MKSKVLKTALDLLIITVGSAIFALSVALFLDPYGIVPGGITGVAMLIVQLWPVLPLGVMVLLLNAPLFLLSWRLFGHRFLLYTAYGTVISSVLIDLCATLPHFETQPLLAGIFGGVLMGVGLGLVFTRGATTGGSDIIARLLKVLFPHVQMGRLMLLFDGCVVVLSGLVFGSVDNMFYAAIAVFISTRAMDSILYGLNIERMVFIISDESATIVKGLSDRMDRGATLLHGEGSYTGQPKNVILCAIKRQQIAQMRDLVREIDPKAFVIVSEAHEVLGEGFQDYGHAG